MSSVIGITFGNTSSSIAVATQDGKVDVIANPDGDRAIPSVLSYIGTDEYHGAQAQAQLVRNAANTIVNFRDFLGKKYAEIDASVAAHGATPIETANGGVGYKITRENGEIEEVSVEEATTRHFKQLKLAAEDYLGKEVVNVVLTVPTDFSEHQKQVLVAAVAAAGMAVVQEIHEPSAALLAHLTAYSIASGEDRMLQDKLYVVADFGGIRSDAAVISVRGGIMTILATAHEKKLGGDDLDAAILEYFAKEFEKKFKANPRLNARSLAKLKAESIVAKKTLSNVQSSSFSVESLAEGYDFLANINRMRFELAARKPLSDMTAFVEKVLAKAGLDSLYIDEVLLAGGCANVVKLAQNVQFVFPESTTVIAPSLDPKATNPEELSTKGAALQAALVEGFDADEIKESLQPVVVNTQHLQAPIGIKDAEGAFQPLLVAETAYPIKKAIQVTNGQAADVVVELYEGKRTIKETVVEREPSSDDDSEDESDDEPEIRKEVVYVAGELLAKLALTDLKPDSNLEVIVNITQNGTLHLTGRELKHGGAVVKGEVKGH
ncbi:actin-like ATPase domain-containing protein [Metschnikowia bicuspidata var. bicuspidata NRRL YB-4993]|uniref:Actin-like ATPase domain-containing protein n=1 Tax=Metschnikowia bicuspidata var. bicuspidata NRRL YB-4993 TaxID=869754 RepID=A0A1A0HH24_9ASCO|nr:actin-like ATPase domain-containing protein [Metschnikowia bicuspidata var. bicuspidata NRRL YB-4993]OBA23177.1 actin-like ATPase domain-containing protein [Metschnikowia bicuspidata var. bicuspidata NRRL YB-4993]